MARQTPEQDGQAQPKTLVHSLPTCTLPYFSTAENSEEGMARAQASSPGCLSTSLACAEPGGGGRAPEPTKSSEF